MSSKVSESFKKRFDLLVCGFARLCQGIHHFESFPSELVQTIFDLYYILNSEWTNRNITLQIVDQNVYLNGEALTPDNSRWSPLVHHRGPIAITSDSQIQYNDCLSSKYIMSPIWRMYPLPEHSDGFTLRPVNITKCEDVSEHPYCKYLGIIQSVFPSL